MEKEILEYLVFFFRVLYLYSHYVSRIYIVPLNKSMRCRLISTISFPPSDVQIFYIWLVFRFYLIENLIFMYIQ